MNALEQHVHDWVKEAAQSYDGNAKAVAEDVIEGGCQSGIVGHLINHVDAKAFYDKYHDEIIELIRDFEDGAGCKFEDSTTWIPPRVTDTDQERESIENHNTTLIAWFAFEETVYRMFDID